MKGLKLTVHPGKIPTKGEIEDAQNLLAFAEKEFKEWVKPYFDPILKETLSDKANGNWKFMETPCSYFLENALGLRVMISGNTEADGRKWLHVSLAYQSRLPNWSEIKKVKKMFLGAEAKAIQVFPPESEYVNCHPYVLHLWQCLSEDILPDFRTKIPGGTYTI